MLFSIQGTREGIGLVVEAILKIIKCIELNDLNLMMLLKANLRLLGVDSGFDFDDIVKRSI